MATKYAAYILENEVFTVHNPLSPQTIWRINEYAKLDHKEKPKFKKPNELHLQFEEIPLHTIPN